MNMKLKTTFTSLTIAIAASLVAGCGSDHDDLPPSNPNPPTAQAKGKAVDFYLANAIVTFDNCTGKPTAKTDENGSFTYPTGCNNTALTVTGGVDIGTKLPFTGVIKAPQTTAGILNIASPLTTLVVYSGGNSAAVAAKLGLTGTDANLLTVDPMTSPKLLQQTVVVQQFVEQIQEALVQLSKDSLTPEQAARAASAALAARLEAQTGTADLTSTDFIQAAVQGAVLEAKNDLPASMQANIEKIAANTAALTAAVIQEKVATVNEAMKDVQVNPNNPQATLNNLGTKLDTIADVATSPATANLIETLAAAITSPNVSAADLKELGQAIADKDTAKITQALSDIPEIPASVVDDLKNIDQLKDYIKLISLGLNDGQATDIQNTDNTSLSTTGSLNSVQVKLGKMGAAFQGNNLTAQVGLNYRLNNGNTLDLVVDRVNMTFDNNGILSSATVPLNANYSFRTTGTATLVGTSTNKAADILTVSNGAVSLPIDTFLNKLAGASKATSGQVENYRPKSGNTVAINVALNPSSNSMSVPVGIGSGTVAKAISVNANSTVMGGQGVSATITIQ